MQEKREWNIEQGISLTQHIDKVNPCSSLVAHFVGLWNSFGQYTAIYHSQIPRGPRGGEELFAHITLSAQQDQDIDDYWSLGAVPICFLSHRQHLCMSFFNYNENILQYFNQECKEYQIYLG